MSKEQPKKCAAGTPHTPPAPVAQRGTLAPLVFNNHWRTTGAPPAQRRTTEYRDSDDMSRQSNYAPAPHLDSVTVSDRERQSRAELAAISGDNFEETWRAGIDNLKQRAQQALEAGDEKAAGFLASWAGSREKKGPEWERAYRLKRTNRKYNAACKKCGADVVDGPIVITGREHRCLCVVCAEKLAEENSRWYRSYAHEVNHYGHQSFKRENFKPCQHCERLVMRYKVSHRPSRNNACCRYCREAINRELRRSRPDPVECPICRETFEPQRKSATYCGPTCRQKAKRLRDAFNTPLPEAHHEHD